MTGVRIKKQQGFDEALFRSLWAQRVTHLDIAVYFNLTVTTVVRRAKLLDLPARSGRSIKIDEASLPKPPKPKPPVLEARGPFTAKLDLMIFETGGKYADLAQLAAKKKIPLRAIQQRSHMLRSKAR